MSCREQGRRGAGAVVTGRIPRAGDAAPSRLYAHGVLALLVLAYAFNILDRTMIAIVGQAIKIDMKLSDAELGLLGGFAFAVLYSVLGLPVARLAERWHRVSIISIAMVVWSGFTAACGVAGNYTQLLLARIGVGVGEAGLSPPASASRITWAK